MSTFPPAIVNPEIAAVFPDWTLKTRPELFALTVITAAPGPVIVTFLSTSS